MILNPSIRILTSINPYPSSTHLSSLGLISKPTTAVEGCSHCLPYFNPVISFCSPITEEVCSIYPIILSSICLLLTCHSFLFSGFQTNSSFSHSPSVSFKGLLAVKIFSSLVLYLFAFIFHF